MFLRLAWCAVLAASAACQGLLEQRYSHVPALQALHGTGAMGWARWASWMQCRR